MWAVNWCFCHNGEIPLFEDKPDHFLGKVRGERFYYPVGDTDSEATFCAILNAIRAQFSDNMPSLPVLYDTLQSLCQEIVDYNPHGTILNFLLACGPHVLWAYSWPGQRPGSKVWNGLHYLVQESTGSNGDTSCHEKALQDEDMTVKVKGQDNICIVATKPLSNDDAWVELKRGELLVIDSGLPYVTPRELFRVGECWLIAIVCK
jgi:predicted glutamine amidotransferase